jgi:hypothetical protein
MALFMDVHTMPSPVGLADVADAPDAEAAVSVHREAHGLVAEATFNVAEGS